MALCKVQTVNFERLAQAFNATAQVSSNLRRIQRFIAKFELDPDLIARFIFALLPEKTNLC
ncbi:MAG: IS4 family transposase, partial [Bacteroidales bacterium]